MNIGTKVKITLDPNKINRFFTMSAFIDRIGEVFDNKRTMIFQRIPTETYITIVCLQADGELSESRCLKSIANLFGISNNEIVKSVVFSNAVGLTYQQENPDMWEQMYPNYEVWVNQYFQIQSKSESKSIRYYLTIEECKKWFENYCNIPWNWKVVTPNGDVIDGELYQTW
jgi:hypothetical protein